MELINNYNNAIKALYDHVGFDKDWDDFPLDNRTNMFWKVDESNNCIYYAENMEEMHPDGDYYKDRLYRNKTCKKYEYKGKNMTMILVDTDFHGYKFSAFYDNDKEVKI